MGNLKWTRGHKSECGRFWCYKSPRADEWQLWDRETKGPDGHPKRTLHRTLKQAKEYADYITRQGKPLIDIL